MSLFLGYVVAVVGVVLALALILIQRFDPQGFALLRSAAVDVTAPFSAVGNSVVRGVSAMGGSASAYIDAGSKNRAMKAELDDARRRLIAARVTETENRRLRATLRVIEPGAQPIAVARLIASDASAPRRIATLAAGRRAGVRPGQPVRSADGLVGRVVLAGQFASRILLLTDGGSAVPVRVIRSGAAAIATGRGDGAIEIRALIGGGRPFKRGDIVATSGTGGLFAPNIPVAIVVRADGDVAIGWPLADPAKQDVVIVDPPFHMRLPTPAPSAAAAPSTTPPSPPPP